MSDFVSAPEVSHQSTKPLSRTGVGDLVATTLVVTSALWLGLRPFREPDVWWHLRVGDQIRRTGQLSGPDPWARFAEHHYTATQWLPEIVASWTFGVFGMGGVLWLRATTVLIIATTIYFCCRSVSRPGVAAAATVMALLAATPSLNPRPQLLSFLFFSITLWAWRATASDLRARWWLVPMFWVWACCHGLWIFGLAMSAVTVMGMACDRRTKLARNALRRHCTLIALCGAAVAATPLGPTLLLAPAHVADNAAWVAREWQRTPLGTPASVVAVMMLSITALRWLRRPFPKPWQVAQLCVATIMLFWMWRLVPLAVITLAPLFAESLAGSRTSAREFRRRLSRPVAAGLAAASLVAVVAVSITDGERSSRFPGDVRAADAVLDCLPDGEVIFNDFGLGSWLLWHHPDLTPVADLRVEIYSRQHLEDYFVAIRGQKGWEETLSRADARFAFLVPQTPLASLLERDSGWVVAAAGEGGVLFRRRDVFLTDGCPTST